jgi:hypothetical protein
MEASLCHRFEPAQLDELGLRDTLGAPSRERWNALVRPVLEELGSARLVELTGFSRSSVQDNLRDRHTPRPERFRAYARLAAREAAHRLADWRVDVDGMNGTTIIELYASERAHRRDWRRCESCDAPLVVRRFDMRFCSDRCRQRSRRSRAG